MTESAKPVVTSSLQTVHIFLDLEHIIFAVISGGIRSKNEIVVFNDETCWDIHKQIAIGRGLGISLDVINLTALEVGEKTENEDKMYSAKKLLEHKSPRNSILQFVHHHGDKLETCALVWSSRERVCDGNSK